MKKIFLVIFTTILGLVSYSQDKTKKEKALKLDGQIAVTAGNKNICVNIGGPLLRFYKKNNFSIGVGCYPSLRYMTDTKRFMPNLGLGPSIGVTKKTGILLIFYYNQALNTWATTYGLSYKF